MKRVFSGLSVPEWWTTPSGLILPSTVPKEPETPSLPQGLLPQQQRGLLVAERPEELPGAGAFATLDALNLEPIELRKLGGFLNRLPREVSLLAFSRIQARLWATSFRLEQQEELAIEFFGHTNALPRILAFLQNGPNHRVVLNEQALTLLQWLVIAGGGDGPSRDLSDLEFAWLRRCLLGAADLVDSDVRREAGESQPTDAWLTYLTRNLVFNARHNMGNAIPRTWQVFHRLTEELDSSVTASWVPLRKWFREDYHLGIEQQLSLGFALHAHLRIPEAEERRGHPVVLEQKTLNGIYDRMKLSDAERHAARALISAPLDWYRNRIEGLTIAQAGWEQVPFMQRPFLRLDDDRYLLMSPRALEAWMIDGPYYRGHDSARKRGDRALLDYTAYIGELTERYALDLVKSCHKGLRLPNAGVVHGEIQYGNGAHSSDIAVTYANDVVLLEVSSRRLSLASRRDGEHNAMEADLSEMLGKRLRQFRRCIEAIKPATPGHVPTLRYRKVDGARIARFWPIAVTSLPLGFAPLLDDYVQRIDSNALARADIEGFDVIPIEELEAMLAVVEHTGRRLVDLLARKRQVVGRNGDVSRWLFADSSVPNIARPGYLEAIMDDVFDRMLELLGFSADARSQGTKDRDSLDENLRQAG